MAIKSSTKKAATSKSSEGKFGKETYVKWYKDMLLIRRFEEKTGQLYIQQKFGGFCHLYIGQEAIVAGCEAVLRPEDKMITTYRDHAHPIGRGTEPKFIMAELYGKITGVSKGKGGSMHMFDKSHNFFGGHGIVGAHIPMGAGIAFADKYNGNKAVTICFMGDGAIRQGAFHEALNMAMTWKLPVIFVIENNQYAMGTSQQRSTSSAEIYERGRAFGIPGEAVDGMDVLAVKAAGETAVAHCRSGKGPYILEIKTYRYRGHSMSDPAKYRTREEVQKIREEKDAIEHVRDLLLNSGLASDEDLKAIDKSIKEVVNASAEFAKASPEPALSELWTDIYA